MQIVSGLTIGGKYEVLRPLARGGMGAVWLARHAKLGSQVAIKFLDSRFAAAPGQVARFEREARAAANLDTPHVVKVHDYGVEHGTPYLVMELLRGEDLNTRLRKRGRLALPEAAKILSQIGRALRRAHDAGIVHRDLKPANVYIADIDDEEVVKILDFGIAKDTGARIDDATKTGEIFGSPHYMSPEQGRAQRDVDHRADLWAAGVITYRMLTGRLPFPGEALGEVLAHLLVDPFPPVAEVAPDLPAGLDAFFARALAKKPDERFSSSREMVEAFAAVVSASTPRAAFGSMLDLTGSLPAASAPPTYAPILTPPSGMALFTAPPATPRPAPGAAAPVFAPAPQSAPNPMFAPAPQSAPNPMFAPPPAPQSASNPMFAPAPQSASNPMFAPAPQPASNPMFAPHPAPQSAAGQGLLGNAQSPPQPYRPPLSTSTFPPADPPISTGMTAHAMVSAARTAAPHDPPGRKSFAVWIAGGVGVAALAAVVWGIAATTAGSPSSSEEASPGSEPTAPVVTTAPEPASPPVQPSAQPTSAPSATSTAPLAEEPSLAPSSLPEPARTAATSPGGSVPVASAQPSTKPVATAKSTASPPAATSSAGKATAPHGPKKPDPNWGL